MITSASRNHLSYEPLHILNFVLLVVVVLLLDDDAMLYVVLDFSDCIKVLHCH